MKFGKKKQKKPNKLMFTVHVNMKLVCNIVTKQAKPLFYHHGYYDYSYLALKALF